FEEALLLNQSKRKQVQIYETKITELKEEIKTLATNCNLDIELNTTYSGILQQINNITTAQTWNLGVHTLKKLNLHIKSAITAKALNTALMSYVDYAKKSDITSKTIYHLNAQM
ncbi:19443_t:CDS:2, partial [Gigaspora rosea]